MSNTPVFSCFVWPFGLQHEELNIDIDDPNATQLLQARIEEIITGNNIFPIQILNALITVNVYLCATLTTM